MTTENVDERDHESKVDLLPQLVSVIMPLYNMQDYVKASIDSVLNQSYSNFELLIVNDGSTDQTEQIIQQYQDSRIRYFFQKNAGVSAARNTALAKMDGTFFCCLDGDDVLPQNSIQSRIEVFKRSSSISFVDGHVIVFDASLQKQLFQWKPSKEGHVFQDLIGLKDNCFFGPTWMVKRIPGVNYHFETSMSHGEDLLFYISVAKLGEYAYTNDCILHYRKNQQSAMSNLTGLGRGYAALASKLFETQSGYFTFWKKFLLLIKIRKIMFLSFCSRGEYRKSMEYVLLGKTKD